MPEQDYFKLDDKLREVFEELYNSYKDPPDLPEIKIILPLNYDEEELKDATDTSMDIHWQMQRQTIQCVNLL